MQIVLYNGRRTLVVMSNSEYGIYTTNNLEEMSFDSFYFIVFIQILPSVF